MGIATLHPSYGLLTGDMQLVFEDDLESSLDTVCKAAAGPGEGVFGPASLTWRIDREAAIFLGAGRALLLQLVGWVEPFAKPIIFANFN